MHNAFMNISVQVFVCILKKEIAWSYDNSIFVFLINYQTGFGSGVCFALYSYQQDRQLHLFHILFKISHCMLCF